MKILIILLLLAIPIAALIKVKHLRMEDICIEDRVNAFIKDKKVIDIKYAESQGTLFGINRRSYSALIIYEDK